MTDDLEAGFARALTDAAGTNGPADPISVAVTGTASAGANRQTLFVDVRRGDAVTPAVAQLSVSELDTLPLTAEAACVRLAGAAGVPVADTLVASDDPSYVGTAFQISRRVEGMTVPRHILRAVADRPDLGITITRQCGEALARLHALDVALVPAAVNHLTDPSPTVAYVRRLRELAAAGAPSPVLSLGFRWLDAHHPAPPTRPSLVHSDFRNGNLIVDEGGLVAVIDWELTHVGDPMEDLAWLCLRFWRFRLDDRQVGGFGDVHDLRSAYEAAGGTWADDAFRWWKVARTMWWSLILRFQGQAFVDGATSSLVLAASGRRAAEADYDLLMLIDRA